MITNAITTATPSNSLAMCRVLSWLRVEGLARDLVDDAGQLALCGQHLTNAEAIAPVRHVRRVLIPQVTGARVEGDGWAGEQLANLGREFRRVGRVEHDQEGVRSHR